MKVRIDPSWQHILANDFDSPYFESLAAFVRERYSHSVCYPPAGRIFAALDECPFDKVKVVILGQDPYHEPGQATGLAFSVADGVRVPPSLENIFKEIESDTGTKPLPSGDLKRWAEQGVLLLNATLTVDAGRAGSHQGKGWEELTDSIVRHLSLERDGLVFMLWGNYARRKGATIDRTKHLVLEARHPSPLSAHRGFLGCHHFSRANEYLISRGQTPIDWK